jgi:general secretion pathway protein C
VALDLLKDTAVEFLFKRHFWPVHLVFIGGAAFIVARTGNAFVESALAPMPLAGAPRKAPKKVETLPTARLDLERVAKLLNLPVPKPEPEVQEPMAPIVDLDAPPLKSALRVRLLGTLLSASNPEWSVASIQDVVTLRTQTYMVEDLVQTAKILEIERLRVIVLNNGRREYIDGTPGDGMGVPVPIAASPVLGKAPEGPPASVALGTGIKQLSENDYEIPRAEIDKTLSNLNDVAMQARIVPAFKDGQATGFKLFSIRPDSIYTKIGVQNGDVIRRINGYDLNSPEKALEIYSKLKESSRIDIEVERSGAVVRKTYNVRN